MAREWYYKHPNGSWQKKRFPPTTALWKIYFITTFLKIKIDAERDTDQ